MVRTYVNDLLFSGEDDFKQHSKKLDEHIKMKPAQQIPFVFDRIRIDQKEDGTVTLDQTAYRHNVEKLKMDFTFDEFRSLRHRLAWVGATRPKDIASSNLFIQVTTKTFTPNHVKSMNKVVQHRHDTAN